MSRSGRVSMTNIEQSQQTENKWDSAIKDAEAEISEIATRKRNLQRAIAIFRANKREGIPWPKSESNDNLS